MANQRDIKNRIKSIKNTKKITSTMEMVSTAKMKKLQGRLEMSVPYEEKVNKIISHIARAQEGKEGGDNPYFKENPEPQKVLVLQVTGNRGLCGSYNTNVIENTLLFQRQKREEGIETLKYVIGKKAISYYHFINEDVFKSAHNPDDKLTFEDAAHLGTELSNLFIEGDVDEIYISYTKVISSSSQRPELFRLFPVSPEFDEEEELFDELEGDYIFEPNADRIFNYLLPLYVKVRLFTCMLESAFSENFARRIAMKNATDASSEMVKELTLSYNRVRQAKITNEIAEIVGGAAALD